VSGSERASCARANRGSTAHRRHPLLAGRWVLVVVIDTRNHWSYEGGNDEAHRRARCATTRNVLHAVALRYRFWGERDTRSEHGRSGLGSCVRPCSAPRWRRVEDRVEDDGHGTIAHCLHGTERPPKALGLRAGGAFGKQLPPSRGRMGNGVSIRHARVLAHSPCPQRDLRRCVAERLTEPHNLPLCVRSCARDRALCACEAVQS
jgi:hypothetical protein